MIQTLLDLCFAQVYAQYPPMRQWYVEYLDAIKQKKIVTETDRFIAFCDMVERCANAMPSPRDLVAIKAYDLVQTWKKWGSTDSPERNDTLYCCVDDHIKPKSVPSLPISLCTQKDIADGKEIPMSRWLFAIASTKIMSEVIFYQSRDQHDNRTR
jgi:hypothetical protein